MSSATDQVAALPRTPVAPLLVLASYFIAPQPLELAFSRAEIGSLLMAVLIGAMVCGDGQSNWFKSLLLRS